MGLTALRETLLVRNFRSMTRLSEHTYRQYVLSLTDARARLTSTSGGTIKMMSRGWKLAAWLVNMLARWFCAPKGGFSPMTRLSRWLPRSPVIASPQLHESRTSCQCMMRQEEKRREEMIGMINELEECIAYMVNGCCSVQVQGHTTAIS